MNVKSITVSLSFSLLMIAFPYSNAVDAVVAANNIQKHAEIVRAIAVDLKLTPNQPNAVEPKQTLSKRQYDGQTEENNDDENRYQNEITDEHQPEAVHQLEQQSYSEKEPYTALQPLATVQQESYGPSSSEKNHVSAQPSSAHQPQQQQQSAPYGSDQIGSGYDYGYTLAQPLPLQLTAPMTLNQIYNQQNRRLESLYILNYEANFDQVNPRNNSSQWRWSNNGGTAIYPADNGAIIRHPVYSHHTSASSYGQQQRSDGGGPGGYIDLISLPFDRSYNLTSPNNPYLEAEIVYKNNFIVNNMQRILFRELLSCKIFNANQHPFPAALVTNAGDDPRMVNCEFRVTDNQNNFYSFALTNEGVWAIYGHDGLTAADISFTSKRRVGTRSSYYDLVDAGIEYDGRLNAVSYYLNGHLVWTINMLGVPPLAADGFTRIDLGQGTAFATNNMSTTFMIRTGTRKCLDETDPNNPASTTRLVRMRPIGSPYYGVNTTFYDNSGIRSNIVWGQGANLRLYKLRVLRTESLAPVLVLPVVSSSAAYRGSASNSAYATQQPQNGGVYGNGNGYIF